VFRHVSGVTDTVCGYANGTTEDPTYEQVCSDTTGFRETVKVSYNTDTVSLNTLIYLFFRIIDPTSPNRQGGDIGTQYQTGIYYTDERSACIAEKIGNDKKQIYNPFCVEIKPLINFYPAEDYHQDYLKKNPTGYCHISRSKIIDAENIIVDAAPYSRPSDDVIKNILTASNYNVAVKGGTEKPFENKYCNVFDRGLYVDIITGEPLFLSKDKFACSCGWPSFSKPLDNNVIIESRDYLHGNNAEEVKSRVGGTHLGHVFRGENEGPYGVRYCIDSASILFIPYADMSKKGYDNFKQLL
jgi:peptide methionine sulfoxide reductase msrA/msrB